MTFYNVISGILFMGACQAFLQTLGAPAMFMAATLAAIMCNEAVLTSELLEFSKKGREPLAYSLGMKFLDLGTFVVLSYALLILSPVENTFNVNVAKKNLRFADWPVAFLVLLALYWAATWWWNVLAGEDDKTKWNPTFLNARRAMSVPFLAAAAYYWAMGVASFNDIGWFLPIALFVIVVGQMFLKLIMRTDPIVVVGAAPAAQPPAPAAKLDPAPKGVKDPVVKTAVDEGGGKTTVEKKEPASAPRAG
jgi:hypothetical protein